MPISDAQFDAWLIDDTAAPVVLIEATHSTGTVYCASKPFITESTSTPANTAYYDLIDGDVEISERIDRTEIDEIYLANADGEIDSWLDLKFKGYQLLILLGDRSWVKSDYRTVVDGINGGVRFIGESRLAFTFIDRSETLQQTIGSQTQPIAWGRVFNAPAVHQSGSDYKVSDSAITSVTVRDQGITLTGGGTDYTVNLSTATITLVAAPAGQITADIIQTDNDVESVIDDIATRLGISVNSTNLSDFTTNDNDDDIGYYIDAETPAANIIDDILQSVGATYRFNTSGALEIFRLTAPAATADHTIIADDILEKGLSLTAVETPVKTVTYLYRRNYAPQSADSLAAAVSESNRALYSREYTTATATNTLTGVPTTQERNIVIRSVLANTGTEAQDECNRRATLRNTERKIYQVDMLMPAHNIKLGETVDITYPRYGFESGKKARVIGIRRNLTARRLTLDVWL